MWHSVIMQLKVQSSQPLLHNNTKPHAVPAAYRQTLQWSCGRCKHRSLMFITQINRTNNGFYFTATTERQVKPFSSTSSNTEEVLVCSLPLESSAYDALFKKHTKGIIAFFFFTFMACTCEADVISEVDFFIVIVRIRPKETGRQIKALIRKKKNHQQQQTQEKLTLWAAWSTVPKGQKDHRRQYGTWEQNYFYS